MTVKQTIMKLGWFWFQNMWNCISHLWKEKEKKWNNRNIGKLLCIPVDLSVFLCPVIWLYHLIRSNVYPKPVNLCELKKAINSTLCSWAGDEIDLHEKFEAAKTPHFLFVTSLKQLNHLQVLIVLQHMVSPLVLNKK